MSVGVVELDVERLEALEDSGADTAGADRAHVHAFEVVGARDAVGDVPAAIDDPLVGRDVVADEREDRHNDVLAHADAVGVGHLCDGHALLYRCLQVDVVGADTGGYRQLQVRRLADPLGGQIGRPERLRDHDVGVGQLTLEDAVRTVLVGRNDHRVSLLLQEGAQAKLSRN